MWYSELHEYFVLLVTMSKKCSLLLLSGATLQYENYYKFKDVERVPKALRILNDKLVSTSGGILTLDTDLPDTRMNLVFLLDFLVENSGFELVSVSNCVSSLLNR